MDTNSHLIPKGSFYFQTLKGGLVEKKRADWWVARICEWVMRSVDFSGLVLTQLEVVSP